MSKTDNVVKVAFDHIHVVNRFMELYMEVLDKVAAEFEITREEVLDHLDYAADHIPEAKERKTS